MAVASSLVESHPHAAALLLTRIRRKARGPMRALQLADPAVQHLVERALAQLRERARAALIGRGAALSHGSLDYTLGQCLGIFTTTALEEDTPITLRCVCAAAARLCGDVVSLLQASDRWTPRMIFGAVVPWGMAGVPHGFIATLLTAPSACLVPDDAAAALSTSTRVAASSSVIRVASLSSWSGRYMAGILFALYRCGTLNAAPSSSHYWAPPSSAPVVGDDSDVGDAPLWRELGDLEVWRGYDVVNDPVGAFLDDIDDGRGGVPDPAAAAAAPSTTVSLRGSHSEDPHRDRILQLLSTQQQRSSGGGSELTMTSEGLRGLTLSVAHAVLDELAARAEEAAALMREDASGAADELPRHELMRGVDVDSAAMCIWVASRVLEEERGKLGASSAPPPPPLPVWSALARIMAARPASLTSTRPAALVSLAALFAAQGHPTAARNGAGASLFACVCSQLPADDAALSAGAWSVRDAAVLLACLPRLSSSSGGSAAPVGVDGGPLAGRAGSDAAGREGAAALRPPDRTRQMVHLLVNVIRDRLASAPFDADTVRHLAMAVRAVASTRVSSPQLALTLEEAALRQLAASPGTLFHAPTLLPSSTHQQQQQQLTIKGQEKVGGSGTGAATISPPPPPHPVSGLSSLLLELAQGGAGSFRLFDAVADAVAASATLIHAEPSSAAVSSSLLDECDLHALSVIMEAYAMGGDGGRGINPSFLQLVAARGASLLLSTGATKVGGSAPPQSATAATATVGRDDVMFAYGEGVGDQAPHIVAAAFADGTRLLHSLVLMGSHAAAPASVSMLIDTAAVSYVSPSAACGAAFAFPVVGEEDDDRGVGGGDDGNAGPLAISDVSLAYLCVANDVCTLHSMVAKGPSLFLLSPSAERIVRAAALRCAQAEVEAAAATSSLVSSVSRTPAVSSIRASLSLLKGTSPPRTSASSSDAPVVSGSSSPPSSTSPLRYASSVAAATPPSSSAPSHTESALLLHHSVAATLLSLQKKRPASIPVPTLLFPPQPPRTLTDPAPAHTQLEQSRGSSSPSPLVTPLGLVVHVAWPAEGVVLDIEPPCSFLPLPAVAQEVVLSTAAAAAAALHPVCTPPSKRGGVSSSAPGFDFTIEAAPAFVAYEGGGGDPPLQLQQPIASPYATPPPPAVRSSLLVGRVPTPATSVRRALLAATGARVVCVPHFEWEEAEGGGSVDGPHVVSAAIAHGNVAAAATSGDADAAALSPSERYLLDQLAPLFGRTAVAE